MPYEQDESIGMIYVNRMAIDEDDQFEIAAIDTLVEDDMFQEIIIQERLNKAMQAAKDLDNLRNEEQKEGPNHFDFIQEWKITENFTILCYVMPNTWKI